MKRALALGAIFVVGLLSALTLAGGGLSWYTTSTQTTTETTTTTDTMTSTVLCPNGNPNTGGKDGHPGNDSCALDETTTQETTVSPPPDTTSETTTTSAPTETTTEETVSLGGDTETTPSPPSPPPVAPKPRKQHVKPPCKNGTPRVNGRCHPIVRGSG